MSRIPMTKNGFDTLSQELHSLESIDRPAVIKEISSAREFGDLSENAEYRAAKERQRNVEGRISYLRDRLSSAEVIDTSKFVGKKNVVFGAHVTLIGDNKESHLYHIVGEDESNIDLGKISIVSPIAKSLIGKSEGDTCSMPNGDQYSIKSVEYYS